MNVLLSWAKGLISGGIPSWVYVAGAAGIACLVLWLLWSRAEWKADAKEAQGTVAVLQVSNAAQNATIAALQDAIRLRDATAAEHKTTLDEIQKRSSARELALQRAAQDADVAAWLGAHMPAPVYHELRQ